VLEATKIDLNLLLVSNVFIQSGPLNPTAIIKFWQKFLSFCGNVLLSDGLCNVVCQIVYVF